MTRPQAFRTAGRTADGFTLIELMIVLAILAILAAIAYPSYLDAVRRGWRAEARTALLQEMQQQERFRTRKGIYSDAVFNAHSGDGSTVGRYALSLGRCEGQADARYCIRLTARLRGGLSDPQVQELWIDSRGEKGCTAESPRGCWP